MKWPWISRAVSEARLEQACNAAKVGSEYMGQRIASLEKELEYYRDKFESEKERADRAVDALVELSGREPLSAPVRQERIADKDAAKSMAEQVQEIFSDVSDALTKENENDETPEPEPEKVVTVAERLEKIRQTISARENSRQTSA